MPLSLQAGGVLRVSTEALPAGRGGLKFQLTTPPPPQQPPPMTLRPPPGWGQLPELPRERGFALLLLPEVICPTGFLTCQARDMNGTVLSREAALTAQQLD